MVKFFLLSMVFFWGLGGLMYAWFQDVQGWGWLAATLAWTLVFGVYLFDLGQRVESERS